MKSTANIPIGASAVRSVEVTRDLTVAHFHDHMPEVYGTPMMIYLMEVASAAAIEDYLPEGWVSVGVGVNIQHMAATPVGFTVTAKAEVVEVGDRQGGREDQGQQRGAGRGAHGRQVAQVHSQGPEPDVARGRPAAVEVHTLHERVGGEDVQGVARRLDDGGIVARAGGDPGRRRRHAGVDPLEDGALAETADGGGGRSRPRGATGHSRRHGSRG